MMEVTGSVLHSILGTAGAAPSLLPNHAVANEYENPTKCMGQPANSDLPFSALEAESVVFMFNVSLDGVFCTKPRKETVFAETVPSNCKTWEDCDLPVFAPENSLLAMGAHFHSQMKYWAAPHCVIMEGGVLRWQNGEKVQDEYNKFGRFYTDSSIRHAWDLFECKLCSASRARASASNDSQSTLVNCRRPIA